MLGFDFQFAVWLYSSKESDWTMNMIRQSISFYPC